MGYGNIDILLVEDNIHDARFVNEILIGMRSGLKLLRMEDGQDAVDFLFCEGKYNHREFYERPKLILTDLRMPRMDGCELLEKIKADERTKDIPVVVMTTSTLDADIAKSYRSGANSYLVKPIDFETLTYSLKAVFDYWFNVNVAREYIGLI